MEAHFKINDADFEQQFSSCKLAPNLFTHEAHLRLAWIHIRKYGARQALVHITSQIKRFAGFHGDHDKYHETVTVAAVRAVHHFIRKSSTTSFQDFIAEFPRLKYEFASLLDQHYSASIFKSKTAKKDFLPPDLIDFDPLD